MAELMIDYDSSVWQRIGAMLIAQSPYLLAYIVAIIVAMIFIGKRTKPALLVAIASVLMLVWTILHTALAQFAWERVYTGEVIPEDNQGWFIALEIGWIVVQIASLALFVIAALGWRSTKETSGFAAVPGVQSAVAVGVPQGAVPLADGPTKPISKGLYILLIFGLSLPSLALLIPAIGILIAQNEDLIFVSLGFSCMAMIGGTVSAVMSNILIYKLWATIQDGPARTTPGKAVGFLFIPFFNLYWVFQAVWGWSVDFNKYTAERGIAARRVPEGMALTLCIIAVIPYVNILASPVTLVISWIFLSRAIDGANAVRSARGVIG